MRLARFRGFWAVILCAALVAFLTVPGCSGDDLPMLLQGTWTVMLSPTLCPVLDGFLNQLDGQESFFVTQDGNALSASFTDQDGNSVTFSGFYRGGRVIGTFSIRESGGGIRTLTVEIEADAQLEGGVRKIDGKLTIVDDSEDLCDDLVIGLWATVDGVGTGILPAVPAVAFLGRRNQGDIDVLDLTTMTIVRTLPEIGGYRLAHNPSNHRIYSTGGLSISGLVGVTDAMFPYDRVTSFDPSQGCSPNLELGIPTELEAICLNPAGTRLYTFDEQGENALFVLDTAANATVDCARYSFQLDEPENCVVGPNGQFVFVVDNSCAAKIDVVPNSPDYLQIVGTYSAPSDSHGIALNGSGTKLYVDNAGIDVVDPATMNGIGTIAGAPGGYFLRASQDGRRIYAVDEGSRLTVIDTATDTGTVIQLFQAPDFPVSGARGVCDTPDGSKILVATASGLAVVDATTLQQIDFMAGSWRDVVAVPSPDQPPTNNTNGTNGVRPNGNGTTVIG